MLASALAPAAGTARAPAPSPSPKHRYPPPVVPFDNAGPEPTPTETLADAIEAAYRTNPTLNARRYDLRATDEGLAQARAQLRMTGDLQVSGGYDKTVPGETTQALRSPADRLRSPIETRNDMASQITVTQPLYTGGRAAAAIASAGEDIRSGRESLRATEGDLLQQLIGAYADVRRDTAALRIRQANVRVLEATIAEVAARREAGELTRTDVAQAETQLYAARVQQLAAEGQLQASRAAFAALVGHDPGVLAPEPALAGVPATIDAAFDAAEASNPEFAQAIHAERASRARIAAARAEGNPQLALRGTATLSGQAAPYHLYDQDQSFGGRLTLTIPLSQGGRVASLIAQAADRNAADRLHIEAARRQMVQAIVVAWNQMGVATRSEAAQRVQLAAARIYYEGTFEEYRAGLRSTFDVLFAQNSLRDTELALLQSRRDRYVGQAILLRQLGRLEVGKLMTGTALYDQTTNVRQAERRASQPLDDVFRAVDRLGGLDRRQIAVEQPERLPDTSSIVRGARATKPLATRSRTTPLPGTTGGPRKRKR